MSEGLPATFLEVAVDVPLLNTLTYRQNDDFQAVCGDIVHVQLGKRSVSGVVIEEKSESKTTGDFEIKSISALDPEWPRLTSSYLKWTLWIADYYIHPPGQVLQLAFPPLRKSKQKKRVSRRPNVIPTLEQKQKPTLSSEQKKCLDEISVDSKFHVHLIHGVTGSGKTEIYLRLFEQCLQANKKGLFLVPEISLTPQLVNRFVERFGNQVAVLHSQLTDRERTNQWWEMIEGEKKILIGARSALFCPVDQWGLIVVDEEHESSFKQDEKLKYHGRDCAVMLGKFFSCPVILGSATPSLESWKNVIDQKYKIHTLEQRIADRPLPEIEVIDMRLEKENQERDTKLPSWLSQSLFQKMQQTLSKKEQVALLLNRRGMAHVVCCQSCGHTQECPNCDISLTLHAHHHMVCHYCDYRENLTTQCPSCHVGQLSPLGLGTEKIEDDLRKLFPESKIARADRDEIQNRLDMEQLISDMETGQIDILIGTQMIAKGLDFPKLNLVGLVLADIGFNLPDFRSTEKNFQLMTQMSGRSGRHKKIDEGSGEVVVQAFNTTHEALQFSKTHDYLGFAKNELNAREPLGYPPFQKMVSFRLQAPELPLAHEGLRLLKSRADQLKSKNSNYEQIQILGPAAAPLSKLKNQFRFHMLLKCQNPQLMNKFVRQILSDQKWVPKKIKIIVDVDPMNLL